jgi:RNA polymerase sigma-70 factor, ECF subfamily
MSKCVQKKINLMPENYRPPLFLDMQGYSNQEIASILNCTLENVKIRLHRARRKMKEILGNDCNFYYDERNVLCCESKK